MGAVIAALGSSLNGSVPAIAVSTGKADCEKQDEAACHSAHFDRVAAFTAKLVSHLQSKPGILANEKGLLPLGVGLNINYPPIEKPKGIKLSVQGQTAQIRDPRATYSTLQLNFTCAGCAALPLGNANSL